MLDVTFDSCRFNKSLTKRVTCSRVQIGKHLSDMFTIRNGLKQGDATTPLFVIFAIECASRRVRVNQDGSKINDTHQLLIYADNLKILD
jgi:hypothetical protein